MKICTAIIGTLLCAACVSTGTNVSDSTASSFKEGVTTEQEVIHKLGQPQQTMVTAEHHRILVYVGTRSHATAATYVPVVGLFAGGAKGENSTVTFEFNQDETLLQMAHSTGQTDVHTGLLNQGSTR